MTSYNFLNIIFKNYIYIRYMISSYNNGKNKFSYHFLIFGQIIPIFYKILKIYLIINKHFSRIMATEYKRKKMQKIMSERVITEDRRNNSKWQNQY